MAYVIQSKWWPEPSRWVRHYWARDHWTTDAAHAEHYHNFKVAKIYLEVVSNAEHPDSGLPQRKGKKQDWTARGGPERDVRTGIEIAQIT